MEERLDLERFISDRNVQRYRKLACAATTEAERGKLLGLLAEAKGRCFGQKTDRRAS
jgi:hypothetical protein